MDNETTTLDGMQQLQAGATENMGTVGMVTQTQENIRRSDQGETTTTSPTSAGTGLSYQATHYGGTLPEPRVMVATSMSKITPETQRKIMREIFNLLNTQGSDLRDLNGEDTLFTALFVASGAQQVKVVYGMRVGTARIGQTLPIANKLLTLYGEGGPTIGPSQTLVLDSTVRYKVLVKNLTPEDVQTGFINGHAVDQQIERASYVTKEEEIMKISTIP